MISEEDIPTLDEFLESLKLRDLRELFTSKNITIVQEILEVNDVALQQIGVDKPGHRKRILNEIRSLRLRLSIKKERSIEPEKEQEHNDVSIDNVSPIISHETEPETGQGKLNTEPLDLPPLLDKQSDTAVTGDSPLLPPRENGTPAADELPLLPVKTRKVQPPVPLPRSESADLEQKHIPAIPPRIDLHEDSNENNVPNFGSATAEKYRGSLKNNVDPSFVAKHGDIQRTGSMPLPTKRKAPPPPRKIYGSKLTVEEDVNGDSPEDQKGKVEESKLNSSDAAVPTALAENMGHGDLPPEMRPTALSIVKNKEFIGLMNSVISPKRPAPLPPKVQSPEKKEAIDTKDDDGSSESDDGSPNNCGETVPTEATRRLEDELKDIGMTVSVDRRVSKFVPSEKSGYLEKRGGQNNKKGFKKRWVVFNGADLRYYKSSDKDSRTDCLQIVPLNRMIDVKICTSDGKDKRQQFLLETPNRTFIFASPDHNEIGLWANVLMQAIILKKEKPVTPEDSVEEPVGGDMCDPDKEGWLKKQGHNVAKDWKDRYVAFKDGKIAYYRNYEDYKQGIPINCLNMALSTVKQEPSRCRITMITAQQRDFVFEASDEGSYQSWVTAFETSIQIALGDTKVLNAIQENSSNKRCADCGKRNPVWASVNLLVIVCDQCIGFHRRLGAQISKARSVLMDEKVWNASLKELMQKVGNKNANLFWEHKLPEDDKIKPDSSSEQRYEFIVSKYKEKRYISFSEFYGQQENLGEALRRTVVTDDVLKTLQLIICGASIYYTIPGDEDQSTPYELATAANQELQMELLRQFNGHYTAEEREKEEREEAERIRQKQEEAALTAAPPPPIWEKQGTLLKRGPKNNEPWRPRTFYLQKRDLVYQKDQKDEVIDLKQAIDIQLGANEDDPKTINIVLPNRTYYLKGETVSDARSWYWALKNKQVFGVAIENQELNGKKVPLLVAKCVDYVKFHALKEEGIYRKNGSTTTIRALKLAFNQDASAVRLTIDEYPFVHDVCGILKLYFREGLQEPLMTNQLYDHFIANSAVPDHETRMINLYTMIKELPEVNFATLKCLVVHLDEIIRYSGENKMTKENVNRVFAPIIINQGKSTKEHVLNREYAIFDDILTYYTYFFDIDPSEEAKKLEEFENARKGIEDAMMQRDKISEGFKIEEIQISVSIQDGKDSCMVKVDKKMTASEVCLYIIKLKSLSLDGNWALFQRIGAARLERPLHTKEVVFPLLMESIKQQDERVYMLKNNYVFEMTAPYIACAFAMGNKLAAKRGYGSIVVSGSRGLFDTEANRQDVRLSMRGKIHFKKNDGSWKEHYLVVRTGDLILSLKERGPEVDKLPIHQWLLFIGNDERAKKKPPKRHGFCLINDNEKRYFCTDDEKYMYRWISAILQIKYPNGIWTNLQEAERRMTSITEDLVPLNQRKSMFLGRQSTVLRAQGSSSHVQKELEFKKRSLKKVR